MKMQDLMLKFPHLPEKILQKLDCASLFKCREVSRSLQNIIDRRNYPWLRIVNIPTILKEGNCYLNLAATTSQIEAFKTALKDVNIKNEREETPFHLACKNGHYKIVQLLLVNNSLEIDFNAKEKYMNFTAFHLACKQGHLDVVKIIVENATALSIDLNAKCILGNTPFIYAGANGFTDIVKIFMENAALFGIDLNAKDDFGLSPFLFGCNHGNIDMVNVFMENATNLGIDLNVKTSSEYHKNITGFHLACRNGHTNVVKIFLKNAANLNIDLNAKSTDGYTGFNLACKNGESEVVKILKENAEALSINLKKNLFTCYNCSKNFRTKKDLKKHVLSRHPYIYNEKIHSNEFTKKFNSSPKQIKIE